MYNKFQYFKTMSDIKDVWTKETDRLKSNLLIDDSLNWIGKCNELKYIGGVDISFIKGDDVNACAAYVILKYPSLDVVYEDYEMIKLTASYIPGFLAFREVDHLVRLIKKATVSADLIFVDGNGILHPHEFGLACHLGVRLGIPTVGVAKKLFMIDGLNKKTVKDTVKDRCRSKGDSIDLIGNSGKLWGAAMIGEPNEDGINNPIYISVGHMISLNTAKSVTKTIMPYRVPEPIRLADIRSREYLRRIKKID
jgi:deoxyinosine 3'endonuclease (endonuclease V)